jgi:hypothetical protein
MTIARLSDPATYTAFDLEERMRMTRYRNRVDELQGFRFFASGNETVRMFSNRDGVESAGRRDFDREGFLAVATPFRILYDNKSPTGFSRVTKLLGEHVRKDLSDYPVVVQSLRDLRKAAEEASKSLPIGITLESTFVSGDAKSESITAPELLDVWLNGDLFHDEPAKNAVRQRFDVGGMGLFNLCWIMRRLNHFFVIGRDLVAPLVDATEIGEGARPN